LYGDLTKNFPTYNFSIDASLPSIDPSPTANEDLSTKPIVQQSYKEQYQNGFQPTTDTEEYRKLYYTLQRKVDAEMGRVLEALQNTCFRDNTIVVFTSDHGDLLGAHGNFQKWFNMYEEAIHVPLTFYSPTLLPQGVHVKSLTSHVDLLPTLCGLADINASAITTQLEETFTDSRALVGRDLSNVVRGVASSEDVNALNEPILFLTYDQILTGPYTVNPVGTPYQYVSQPAFIHAVIAQLDGESIWKLAMYFNNKNFTQAPLSCTCSDPIDPSEYPDIVQFEMYNLTNDPLESTNLADSKYATPEAQSIQAQLLQLLQQQINQKALQPTSSQPLLRALPVPS
jgi:arylsulfatase A-like enzyme